MKNVTKKLIVDIGETALTVVTVGGMTMILVLLLVVVVVVVVIVMLVLNCFV